MTKMLRHIQTDKVIFKCSVVLAYISYVYLYKTYTCTLSLKYTLFYPNITYIYAISTQAIYIYTVSNTPHTFSLGRTTDWFVAPDFAAFC